VVRIEPDWSSQEASTRIMTAVRVSGVAPLIRGLSAKIEWSSEAGSGGRFKLGQSLRTMVKPGASVIL
jgi:hypothetical protein